MALTPEGTPYVESTDLVANYPAASLSLANRVDLVGVLPFATSAARATAIPSPTDGQYSYLQDTNATEFWNGAAWVAAGVAPGLVHINTTTVTAQSSVSINNCFSATYDYYRIVMQWVASTDAGLAFRLRVSGTDNSANNYVRQRLIANSTSITGEKATSTSMLFVTGTTGSNNLSLDIFRPFIAANTSYNSLANYSDGDATVFISAGSHTVASSFDGISFIQSSGNFTGVIRVYGYKNS